MLEEKREYLAEEQEAMKRGERSLESKGSVYSFGVGFNGQLGRFIFTFCPKITLS